MVISAWLHHSLYNEHPGGEFSGRSIFIFKLHRARNGYIVRQVTWKASEPCQQLNLGHIKRSSLKIVSTIICHWQTRRSSRSGERQSGRPKPVQIRNITKQQTWVRRELNFRFMVLVVYYCVAIMIVLLCAPQLLYNCGGSSCTRPTILVVSFHYN